MAPQQPTPHCGGRRLERLAIEANDLLRTRHDPRLARRQAAGSDEQTARIDAEVLDQVGGAQAGGVVSHDGTEGGGAAQGHDVARDVGGAPEDDGLLAHVHHGDRRLRAHALDLAPHVFVEDEVSHHQQPHLPEATQQRLETGQLKRGHRLPPPAPGDLRLDGALRTRPP